MSTIHYPSCAAIHLETNGQAGLRDPEVLLPAATMGSSLFGFLFGCMLRGKVLWQPVDCHLYPGYCPLSYYYPSSLHVSEILRGSKIFLTVSIYIIQKKNNHILSCDWPT